MLCPLNKFEICKYEKCAWWQELNRCAILAIADIIMALTEKGTEAVKFEEEGQ
jgi:hypothetical protein